MMTLFGDFDTMNIKGLTPDAKEICHIRRGPVQGNAVEGFIAKKMDVALILMAVLAADLHFAHVDKMSMRENKLGIAVCCESSCSESGVPSDPLSDVSSDPST